METWELDLKCPFREEKKFGKIVYNNCYKHRCPYFVPVESCGWWCNRVKNDCGITQDKIFKSKTK